MIVLYPTLRNISKNISSKVNEASLSRCPYKNADDRCTAKFGCRNQRNPKVNDLFGCNQKDNDKLDYRSFWEMPDDGTD